MKKFTLIFVMIFLFIILVGCSISDNKTQKDDTQTSIQQVYDLSVKAEEYTYNLFKLMMTEKGISEYEIKLTSGGFITGDKVIFISGYRYEYDGKQEVYGYKLHLNDDGNTFTVIEEGVEIGEFVLN